MGKIDLIPLKHRSLEEEAKRRDFTVNGLLLPLSAVRGKTNFKEGSNQLSRWLKGFGEKNFASLPFRGS